MKLKACLNKQMCMFGISFLILIMITAVILGLIAAPYSPITWFLVISLIFIPSLMNKMSTKQFVEWKDEYSVGLDSIDNQHKKLLNLINQLQTAVDYSTGEEFEREALDELVDYTKTHFSFEEGLMKDNGYPDYEPHKAQHDKMVKHVEEVLSEYERDQHTAMANSAEFLKDWLITHINGTDKQYSEFLIGKGVN